MAIGRKTGGRVKGSKNKKKERLEKAFIKSDLSPLEYMLKVMCNPNASDQRRDDMAKAAAPYLHAKRAPEDAKGRTVPPMVYVTPDLEG